VEDVLQITKIIELTCGGGAMPKIRDRSDERTGESREGNQKQLEPAAFCGMFKIIGGLGRRSISGYVREAHSESIS